MKGRSVPCSFSTLNASRDSLPLPSWKGCGFGCEIQHCVGLGLMDMSVNIFHRKRGSGALQLGQRREWVRGRGLGGYECVPVNPALCNALDGRGVARCSLVQRARNDRGYRPCPSNLECQCCLSAVVRDGNSILISIIMRGVGEG